MARDDDEVCGTGVCGRSIGVLPFAIYEGALGTSEEHTVYTADLLCNNN